MEFNTELSQSSPDRFWYFLFFFLHWQPFLVFLGKYSIWCKWTIRYGVHLFDRIVFSNFTDQPQVQVTADGEQNQTEAEQQGSPQEESMETKTSDGTEADQKYVEREERKKAKVCPKFQKWSEKQP